MMNLRTLLVAPILTVLALLAAGAPATADDNGPVIVGNATGGGDIPGAELLQSPAEQAEALAKLQVARAELAQETTGIGSPASCPPEDPCPATKRILDVTHAAQVKGYYCGPASGFMVLRYLSEGDSAYNGASLTQDHVAGADHMRTDINGSTPWSSGLFRTGLNRWREGTNRGFYVILASPSNSDFRAALRSDIDDFMPFGVSTLELFNQNHYNGHPTNQTIGHWLVAQGYDDGLDTTSFDDPAAQSDALGWPNVDNNFQRGTNSFNSTFVNLDGHGIVW